ncbi:hydroxymethylbilane synthase [Rubritepida flocculans]|uniref:hydroxymethylbilane synthase n=1 Tax=Rubritepida flocculans TaxID=182403 RepID=UPI0004044ED5|nr:hydroxymethylbilane synthase [Rubritepida flocculans]
MDLASPHHARARATRHHGPQLPLRVGTRGSPLALYQTRYFLDLIRAVCPLLREVEAFEEHEISTAGDRVQDRRLAEIGGKGLFAKEIHEALLDGRVDFAVHSLKDLETELPPGIVLACTLRREDPRDALVLGEPCLDAAEAARQAGASPYAALPFGALIGTASVRRQAQLLHARPDLRCEVIRGNVQTRLSRVGAGEFDASLLAIAGLKRLGLEARAGVVLDPDDMVPAACQGIIGVTVRADDVELHELLSAICDPDSRPVSLAERALLGALDGSCRTPIGGHATLTGDGQIRLTGLVARADGSFLLRRTVTGCAGDAERLGRALGEELAADSPADIFG